MSAWEEIERLWWKHHEELPPQAARLLERARSSASSAHAAAGLFALHARECPALLEFIQPLRRHVVELEGGSA